MTDALFPDDGLRVAPAEPWGDDRTTGQKMRDRQAARIRRGYHPLPFGIPLHPDAPRVEYDDGVRTGLRCGSCRFRELVGGHARSFPKCFFGYSETPIPPEQQGRYGPQVRISHPRATNGEASDVRAWFPACKDYEPTPEDA